MSIAYVHSAGLGFEEKKGRRTIHRNDNSRVANVAGDVQTNLQLSAEGG